VLEWMDGFEHYGLGGTGIANALNGAYASFGTDSTIINTNARTGSNSLSCQGSSSWRRVFSQSRTKFGVGAAFYLASLPGIAKSTQAFSFLDNNAAAQVTFFIDTSGTISAWSAAGGVGSTLYARTTSPVVPARAYTHIEVMAECDDSAVVEVRVNGVTVLNATGLDTDPTTFGSIAQVAASVGFSDAGFIIDDLFAWNDQGSFNNNFIGDKKVYTSYPSADTAQADWVPSVGGTGWNLLATVPPNDAADYVEADNAGELSVYAFDDLPTNVVIAGVATALRTWKTDAGSSHVTAGLLSGSANADGADHSITSAPTYWGDVFEADPATGALWTVAALNAAQVYIDRTI
jgi:hypothetical protein